MIHVVNMIPAALSGESSQDSEPNIAVNPQNPNQIVGTAFTPAPTGGAYAPIYISTDGGNTWALRTVVPGNGFVGTSDISIAFGSTGGMLYAGILNGQTIKLQILRTSSFTSTAPMTVLVERASEDQPWLVAGSVVVSGSSKDRVFVGNNDFGQPAGGTATVDLSADAATAAPPAGFGPHQVEKRATTGQDGPPVRLALHPDGTVYAAFERWVSGSVPNLYLDVVVTRDDSWGTGGTPFADLVDAGDGKAGQRVATNRFIRWNDTMGQERLGGDLAIAVDPHDSGSVWVAWCDRAGGPTGTDWTLHVSHSSDRGQTWSSDVRTITNAKNPSLAVNSNRQLGLLYQQYTGTNWATQLEITSNAWGSPATVVPLHSAPATAPSRTFLPYLGDYVRLLAVGTSFYGVFCGNNTPDHANFPSGVTYQRAADFTSHTLFSTDGMTPVAVSIDPFFFHWSPFVLPRLPRAPIRPISREPITPIDRGPISPINPRPITREPIIRLPQPITRTPIGPDPGPIHEAAEQTPKPAPRRRRKPGGASGGKIDL
jgi:hypothetical protein